MRGRRLIERVIEKLGYRVIRIGQGDVPLHGYVENRLSVPNLEIISDEELAILNKLLPWASFVVDAKGRRFGAPFSFTKRSTPEVLPDPRIVELDRRMPLNGLKVVEVGCFESSHTSALCGFGANVVAIDARVENVVKTIVRCAFLEYHPNVLTLDLEEPLPSDLDLRCDVMHHVGVLYHLVDPVDHLYTICPFVERLLMLDTHVARENPEALQSYDSHGRPWPYFRFSERGRAVPFAGTRAHAKWLREPDLVGLLEDLGFGDIDVVERRDERNGLRVLIYAER